LPTCIVVVSDLGFYLPVTSFTVYLWAV